MQKDFRQELESTLLDSRAKWARRLTAIQGDRRRTASTLGWDPGNMH